MTAKFERPESKPEPTPSTGKTVATPEGDNEFAPDQPLGPIDHGHQKPSAVDRTKL